MPCSLSTAPHGRATFVVTRYEPDRVVEYVIIEPHHVQRLVLALEPTEAGGARLSWVRHLTALSHEGDADLEANVPEHALQRVRELVALLARHLGIAPAVPIGA